MIEAVRPVTVPQDAIDHLRSSDSVMATLVDAHGALEYRIDPDLWRSLVRAIVGQQLSVKAAATIAGRVAAVGEHGFPTPAEIDALSDETLRGCGLSRAKLSYLRDLARKWMAGDIDPRSIEDASDDEVIEHLVSVRGIGRWTAEMALIFSMARQDVLAVDDLGLRSGVQRAYGLSERPGRAEFEALGEAWRPYRSFASLYLWRSLQP